MGFQIHSAFHYKELALPLNWVCTKKPSTGVTEDYQYPFRTDSILHSKNKSGNLEVFFTQRGPSLKGVHPKTISSDLEGEVEPRSR